MTLLRLLLQCLQEGIPLDVVVRCVGQLFSADPLQAAIFGYAAAIDGGYTVGEVTGAQMGLALGIDCNMSPAECNQAAQLVNQALALKAKGLVRCHLVNMLLYGCCDASG
jgi:hypothetical protein